LYRRTLDPGSESLLTYQNDIKRLAHRAYPDMTADQVAPIILTAFIRGLRGHSMSLARKVRNANPKTLQLALEKAQFLLSDPFEDGDVPRESELLAVKRGAYEAPIDGVFGADDKAPDSLLQKSTSTTSSTPHGEAGDTPSWISTLVSALRRDDRRCNYCGKIGHLEAYCFKKQRDKGHGPVQKRPRREDVRDEKSNEGVSGDYPRTMGATCGYCLRKNHTEEQCQTKKKALAL
ncbi:paraneoplastic Ma antigen, partial [Perkinsus olseni]